MQILFPIRTPEAISGASPLSACPQSIFREGKWHFEGAYLRISKNIKNVRSAITSQKVPSNVSNSSQNWMPMEKYNVKSNLYDSTSNLSLSCLLMRIKNLFESGKFSVHLLYQIGKFSSWKVVQSPLDPLSAFSTHNIPGKGNQQLHFSAYI